MRAYSKKDVDKKALKGARIAILGYGSQGRAHALNLKDSGYDVIVGVRRGGESWKKARRDGLAVAEPVEAVKGAALVALLTPDLAQPAVYKDIRKTIGRGAALLFPGARVRRWHRRDARCGYRDHLCRGNGDRSLR